jgi:hypothetical protein
MDSILSNSVAGGFRLLVPGGCAYAASCAHAAMLTRGAHVDHSCGVLLHVTENFLIAM